MSNHLDRTLPYELAAFEGDWWLIYEDEPLTGDPRQRWTFRAGRAFRDGGDVGGCSIDDNCLVLALGGDRGEITRFHPHDAAPLDYLQGNVVEGGFPLDCTLMRIDKFPVPSAGSEDS